MVWQYNFYALPLFLAAPMSLGLVLLMWRRRHFPGAIAFVGLLLLIAEWSLADGLEYMSADLLSILFWDKAAYVGVVFAPVAFLIFVLYHTDRNGWLTTQNISLMFIIPVITLLLRWTDEINHSIYSEYGLVTRYGLTILQWTWGTGFYVDAVYSYVLTLFGIALLLQQFSRSHGVVRRQALILTVSILVPLVASVVELLPVVDNPVDWTSVGFAFTGLGFFWAVFRFRLFELRPVAREAIVRDMPDVVIVLDPRGRLVDINPAGEHIFGPGAEIIGKSITEIFESHGLNRQYLTKETSGISLTVDGVQRYFNLTFSELQDKRRGLVGRIGVLRDVTDLATSERKYHLLLDNMADSVFTIDLQGNLTFASPQTEKMTGYSNQQLLAMNIRQLIAPEDLHAVLKRLDARSQGKTGLVPILLNLIRSDGTRLPIETHTRLLVNEGRPVGVQGVARDITERKRMEDALRESEARFRELADLLPQIVFETDEGGILTFCNRVGLSATGYSEEDLRIGIGAFQAFSPEDARRAIESMRRVMNGEYVDPAEYTLVRKDGTSIPVIIYSSAIIREGKPVGVRGIVVDITERKLMEEKLLRSRRLATIGETAALVGHDLRNPLQGIIGAAYILKTHEKNLSEDGKEMVQVIEDAIKRSDKIVNDLLEYSRELHLDLSPSNATSLVDQTLASMKIPKNINVINQTKEEPTVEVDVEKMKRVCLNIMTNAVDAMPNGGTLTIANMESDGNLLVSFADTGEGIRDEVLAKIWSPLFTTKPKGMGYGLAIVKRLMEAHGGTVSVETNPGKGSTFTIIIPIHRTTKMPIETQTEMIAAT